MKNLKKQYGFTAVEGVIIIVIIAVIGVVAFSVYNRTQNSKNSSTDSSKESISQSGTASDVKSAPNITTTDDLDKASATLDQTDPSSTSDVSQLDNQTSAF